MIEVKKIESALRSLIAELDYDMFKYLEHDEETGEDHFPEIAKSFAKMLSD